MFSLFITFRPSDKRHAVSLGQASASASSCMMTTRLGVGFVRNVIQEAILAIEAEIEERQG